MVVVRENTPQCEFLYVILKKYDKVFCSTSIIFMCAMHCILSWVYVSMSIRNVHLFIYIKGLVSLHNLHSIFSIMLVLCINFYFLCIMYLYIHYVHLNNSIIYYFIIYVLHLDDFVVKLLLYILYAIDFVLLNTYSTHIDE